MDAAGHVPSAAELLDDLAQIADGLATPAVEHLSAATQAAYDADWRAWETWCDLHDLASVPVEPEMVRLYVADLGTQIRTDGTRRCKATTIERHLASLAWHSRRNNGIHDLTRHPRIAPLLAALRARPAARARRTRPLPAAALAVLVDAMDHHTWPQGVTSTRDTLVLLLGFHARLRRTAAASLTVGDALDLSLPLVDPPSLCPRCALSRWVLLMDARDRAEAMALVLSPAPGHICLEPRQTDVPGLDRPLLRAVSRAGVIAASGLSDSAVNQVLKRALAAADMDPSHYGFDSLRTGSARAVR